jgi:putative component of membrane protein insertase Oxa1/YidC/SpoIIIJ protein YidD
MKKSITRRSFYLIVLSLGINCYAQHIEFKTDLEIINKKLSEKVPDPYRRPYIYKDETSVLKKINPANILFGGALFVYQNILSKQISAGCLYTPSCSEFSKNAISEYGLVKGIILSDDRLHRCNSIVARDLKKHKRDPLTNRYPDPVSRYKSLKRRW